MELWELCEYNGEEYAMKHTDIILDIMEEQHYFYNAKTNEKAMLNKFWSLDHDERVSLLYDYFRETEDDNDWVTALKGVQ